MPDTEMRLQQALAPNVLYKDLIRHLTNGTVLDIVTKLDRDFQPRYFGALRQLDQCHRLCELFKEHQLPVMPKDVYEMCAEAAESVRSDYGYYDVLELRVQAYSIAKTCDTPLEDVRLYILRVYAKCTK